MGLNNFQLARFSNCADLFAHQRVLVHGFALVEWREQHKKVSEEEEDYMSKNSVLWNVVLWRITCPFWSLSTALWIQNAIAHLHTGLHDIVPFTRILQSSKYAPLNPKPCTPHMQLHFSRVPTPSCTTTPHHVCCKFRDETTFYASHDVTAQCSPIQNMSFTHPLPSPPPKTKRINQTKKTKTKAPNPEHVHIPSLSFSSTRKLKENNPTNQTKTKAKRLTGLGFRVLVDSATWILHPSFSFSSL